MGDTARKPTVESIGNEVECLCGCNAPLNQCPHVDCAERTEVQGFIKQEIAAGKDEAAILRDLSSRYGMKVLSAPPFRGFNLTVWVLPGIGLLLGLGMVVIIARRWNRKPAPVPIAAPAARDAKVLKAVEEEMKSAGLGRI